jgi:hypothetical protein
MASTQTIKAYGITQYGQPEEVVHVVEIPKPQPGPRDLLVRVVAAATNPVSAHSPRSPSPQNSPSYNNKATTRQM